MKKFVVIHGPNLNLLGQRQPEIYGKQSLEQVNALIEAEAGRLGCQIEIFQSNVEGIIVDLLQQCSADADGIIINPGGYAHTSVAILDALLTIKVPVVEVHLSNVHRREEFRQAMITARGTVGVIAGFGATSYILALQYLNNLTV